MTLEVLDYELTVCKVAFVQSLNLYSKFFFISRTDDEISLVCETGDTPQHTTDREDGWRAFRIKEQLDFSLVGILSGITSILAANNIGVFAVSTYNTDYFLVKEESLNDAIRALQTEGFFIELGTSRL